MNHILFYDDTSIFGGHQCTAIDAVKYLIENTNINISFIFYEGNKRLCERLELINTGNHKINLYPISHKSPIKYFSLEALLLIHKINKIRSLIKKILPDIVILVQGYIELCLPGLIAAKKEKIETVSFIPMANKTQRKGIKKIILNEIQEYLYSLPEKFITTSRTAKNMLIACGAKSDIFVVYYGPDIRSFKIQDKQEARNKYNIAEEDYALALVGRIQFVHKGQDFLVKTLLQHRQKLKNIKLYIVGDGADELQLRQIITSNNMSDIVKFVPWENDLSYLYSAIDMLVIPSWFEGLPLVMLEAMYYGLPIIASNIDGMAELLPNQWLFMCGDSNALVETLLQVMQTDNSELILKNKQLIGNMFNINKFGEYFLKTLIS